MGYPTSLITNNTPGVDIYPPQNGQAFGTFSGQPTGTANPDTPTWFSRVSSELVAIEKALGIPTLTTNGFVQEAPQDGGMYVRQNGLWVPRPATNVQVWTGGASLVSGTWTKPPNAKLVRVLMLGAGGGGASGMVGAPNTARSGGGGGSGGRFFDFTFLAADLPASANLSIDVGGQGGAPVTTDSTTGNPGLTGGNAWFLNGTQIVAWGGSPGLGGNTTTAAGGGMRYALGTSNGGGTGSSAATGGAGQQYNYTGGASGGGGGGGISASEVVYAGGTSGYLAFSGSNGSQWALGGAVQGGAGANGIMVNGNLTMPGSGGGGGAASNTAGTPGGAGGNGVWGGGGGGGGAGTNGQAGSGAGGAGGPGYIIVITFF